MHTFDVVYYDRGNKEAISHKQLFGSDRSFSRDACSDISFVPLGQISRMCNFALRKLTCYPVLLGGKPVWIDFFVQLFVLSDIATISLFWYFLKNTLVVVVASRKV